MASRRFIIARRFKFINTSGEMEGKGSIEIKPTTNLILHPAANLVCSPEGTFLTRVDVDANNKNILNAPNLMTRKKISVAYSDFSAASADEKLKLILASIGDTIFDITANLATPFKYDVGPATVIASIYRMSVGDAAALTGFNRDELCGSSVTVPSVLFSGHKGAYLYKTASTLRMHKVYTANASITAKLNNASGGHFVASLTQGAIHFYIDMIKRTS